jgi:hypothetical protein
MTAYSPISYSRSQPSTLWSMMCTRCEYDLVLSSGGSCPRHRGRVRFLQGTCVSGRSRGRSWGRCTAQNDRGAAQHDVVDSTREARACEKRRAADLGVLVVGRARKRVTTLVCCNVAGRVDSPLDRVRMTAVPGAPRMWALAVSRLLPTRTTGPASCCVEVGRSI